MEMVLKQEPESLADHELLAAYLADDSGPAFTELVRRHVDLVYSTALRITNDPQSARDVSQEVFLKLARQAARVRNGAALPAWLYRVTHGQAVNAVRSESRRRQREEEAMRMTELQSDDPELWETLKPSLDQAIHTLEATEQAAIVLRFFANRRLGEVGKALHLTEEAARKRVSRGLEKLRLFFAGQGIHLSASVLATLLTAEVVKAAPAGLAAHLAAACLSSTVAGGSAGFVSTLLKTFLMTKTTATILAVLALGAVLTPALVRKSAPQAPASSPGTTNLQAETSTGATSIAAGPREAPPVRGISRRRPLLERVALLPPLSGQEVEAYVQQNKRSAESLLAAWRATTEKAWLAEAASRFANHPDVQYEVIASQAFPEAQRQWIEAYKAASPDNALGWYFSALNHLQAGEKAAGIEDLSMATRKPSFRAELASTLQAVEELNLGSGRPADEAKVVAFQTCAQCPELPRMRELAKAMKELASQYRQAGDNASAESLAGMGVVLGAHLSDGTASRTVINQLVGMAIERSFLQEFGPNTTQDPFGRSVADLSTSINQRQAALREYAQNMNTLTSQLDDTEWAVYMERVKLYGEEAALAWLKAKHGQQ